MLCDTLKQFYRNLSKRGVTTIIVLFILSMLIIIGIIVLIHNRMKYNKYCEPDLCTDKTMTHIGCKTSKWGAKCINATQIPFTGEMQSAVLDKINYYRNGFAGNMMAKPYYPHREKSQPNLGMKSVTYSPTDRPPCARCGIIQWDGELATVAELASQSCEIGVDKKYCVNTKNFLYPGKCEVISVARKYIYWLESVVDQWAYIDDRYHVSDEHFTITHEKQTHVGCGLVLFDVNESDITDIKHLYMVCYFAVAYSDKKTKDGPNFIGRGGSKCFTGVDYQYESLCSFDEHIVNDLKTRQVSFLGVKEEHKPYGGIYTVTAP